MRYPGLSPGLSGHTLLASAPLICSVPPSSYLDSSQSRCMSPDSALGRPSAWLLHPPVQLLSTPTLHPALPVTNTALSLKLDLPARGAKILLLTPTSQELHGLRSASGWIWNVLMLKTNSSALNTQLTRWERLLLWQAGPEGLGSPSYSICKLEQLQYWPPSPLLHTEKWIRRRKKNP